MLTSRKILGAGDTEAHAAGARALDLLVLDSDDAALDDADVLPRRLGHVEVRAARAAPAAVGQCVVGRAQVGGGDSDGVAGLAPLATQTCWVAGDEVALPARRAVIEQGRAQRRGVDTVPRVVQVVVPACATCVSYHKYACISDEVILWYIYVHKCITIYTIVLDLLCRNECMHSYPSCRTRRFRRRKWQCLETSQQRRRRGTPQQPPCTA